MRYSPFLWPNDLRVALLMVPTYNKARHEKGERARMVRRLRRQKRIAEEQTSYLANPKPQLPPFASTPDEIQRAVERNSMPMARIIASAQICWH